MVYLRDLDKVGQAAHTCQLSDFRKRDKSQKMFKKRGTFFNFLQSTIHRFLEKKKAHGKITFFLAAKEGPPRKFTVFCALYIYFKIVTPVLKSGICILNSHKNFSRSSSLELLIKTIFCTS